jgi:prevent-host-death family protein
MVITTIFMTMSSSRWNVASAKAELSSLVRQAQRRPQVIERRGQPVAVVLGVNDYRALADQHATVDRWRRFLATSAELREAGGAELQLPKRQVRHSPFLRRR